MVEHEVMVRATKLIKFKINCNSLAEAQAIARQETLKQFPYAEIVEPQDVDVN